MPQGFIDVPLTPTQQQGRAFNDVPLPHETQDATPNTSIGLAAALTSHLMPYVTKGLEAFVTNPNVPKTGAKIGRVMGGIAPMVAGAVEGGPVGAMVGVAAASKGAWAGGKTGYFTGKLAQNAATPAAKIAANIEPYAQGLSTLSGAQSLLDLAQMAEPNRHDIGVLGIGVGKPFGDQPGIHPALLNAIGTAISDTIHKFMSEHK